MMRQGCSLPGFFPARSLRPGMCRAQRGRASSQQHILRLPDAVIRDGAGIRHVVEMLSEQCLNF